jgi:hypothetical protein
MAVVVHVGLSRTFGSCCPPLPVTTPCCASGIETVRRDNCALVRNVIDTCLRKILVERSVAGAVDYAKQTISDLLQNKLDISLLVITKVCWRGEGQRERVQRLPRPLHFVCLDLLTPKSWCPGNSLRGRLFHACCCPQPCLCVRAPGAGQGRRL